MWHPSQTTFFIWPLLWSVTFTLTSLDDNLTVHLGRFYQPALLQVCPLLLKCHQRLHCCCLFVTPASPLGHPPFLICLLSQKQVSIYICVHIAWLTTCGENITCRPGYLIPKIQFQLAHFKTHIISTQACEVSTADYHTPPHHHPHTPTPGATGAPSRPAN